MKSRAVAFVQDPAARVRALLLFALLLGALALGVVAALTATPRLSLAAERYALSGERITIYNLAGHVELVAGSGPDVIVEVTRGGHDADKLKIVNGPNRDRSSLRVLYPSRHVIYPALRGNTGGIPVNDDGSFGDKHEHLFARRSSVSSHGFGTEAWADLRVSVPRGTSLEMHLGAGEMEASNLEGTLLLDSYHGPVTAAGVRGALTVDTGSGDVETRDVDGELSVDTGSGGVIVTNVKGKRVHVDTGSGGVEGSGVTTEDLYVDTGSGHVALEAVRAPKIKVDTGSGGVTLGLLSDIDDVYVDTGSGGVTMRVPQSLGAVLDVDTGSGGIESEVPLTITHRESGELRGTLGDGQGRIKIDTGSGGVRLVKS